MRTRKPLLLAMCAVAFAALGAVPASAQVMNESTCTKAVGAASVTWDCGFNVKDYTIRTPVSLSINYSCAGACGPIMSFGLRDSGFTPAGVYGHLEGGRRYGSGLDITFVFDTLKQTGGSMTGNAHFVMNMLMDDGAGGLAATALPIDVHLNGVHLNEKK